MSKLPPGASKWWSKPVKELTEEQREIKREYARSLYHSKKGPDTSISGLQAENEFLRGIIENYRTYLKRLSINSIMTVEDVEQEPPASLEKYLETVSQEPVKILGFRDDVLPQALIAMAATNTDKPVRFQLPIDAVYNNTQSGKCLLQPADEIYKGVIAITAYADIIYGFYAQGPIKSVELGYRHLEWVAKLGDYALLEEVHRVEYGDITDNYCSFPTPIPIPRMHSLTIIFTFEDVIGLKRWDPGPSCGAILDLGMLQIEDHHRFCTVGSPTFIELIDNIKNV